MTIKLRNYLKNCGFETREYKKGNKLIVKVNRKQLIVDKNKLDQIDKVLLKIRESSLSLKNYDELKIVRKK